jgi:hypothetical protein
LPVTFTTTTASTSDLVEELKLYEGSTLLDTETAPTDFINGNDITFQNLNLTIPAGTTDSFSVKADIQPVDGTNPAPGNSSATVSVDGANISATDVNANSASTVGTATGYPISFAISGLNPNYIPTAATATAAYLNNSTTAQTGTFTFTFDVTAFGQDIYVAPDYSAFSMNIIASSTGNQNSPDSSAITSTADLSPNGNFVIHDGQTKTFTITGLMMGGCGQDYYNAVLSSLNYGTDDTDTNENFITFPISYVTGAVSLTAQCSGSRGFGGIGSN